MRIQFLRQQGIKALFMLIFFYGVLATGAVENSSQHNTITANFKQKPLSQALKEFGKQTNYQFIYSDALVNGKVIDCNFVQTPVSDALNTMLASFFISFRISDKNKVVLFKSKGTVSGRITDSETGAALFFTNVFLANTTKGSTTDKNGCYSIGNIPEGDYTLVVQHIGFELQTIPVPMLKPELLAVDVKLTPKIIKGEAINVVAEQETQLTKEYRLFKKMFLGESKNASQCKILNPEVLNFSVDSESDDFIATTDSVLIIENNALGYRLQTILKLFRYSKQDALVQCVYYPYFELLIGKSQQEQKEYEKNREETYKGSFQHFLSALMLDMLEEEGFRLSLSLFKNRDRQFGYSINSKDFPLISPLGKSNLYTFNFAGYLKVVYEGKKIKENGHLNYQHPHSWLKMNDKTALVSPKQNLVDPLSITKYGYWSEERIADLLPFDYKLDARSAFNTK